MANAIHGPLDFKPLPVGHAPNSLSFGFGLSSTNTPSWAPLNAAVGVAMNPSSISHLMASPSRSSPPRALKRRHGSDDSGGGDEEMDRSPTPERPKRAPPKRARMAGAEGSSRDGEGKENKSPSVTDELADVDLGVLLARLPAHSLVTILSDLIKSQPALKATVLRHVPRPTIAIARQALETAAKKLRDSYPWSNTTSFPPSVRHPPSVGFGFGSAPAAPRDDYVLSRITPQVNEFVATFMTYLPYFSNDPAMAASSSGTQTSTSFPNPSHNEYTTETFDFLFTLCEHLLSQPSVGQSALASLLSKRLKTEWGGWIGQIRNAFINGRMFGEPTLLRWTEAFDRLVEAKGPPEFNSVMAEVREQWMAIVGPYLSVSTLQRRFGHHRMDEF
ncbi:hypothetical protein HGRIS_008008 [Hohenbuehelia grisea]|uniref:Tethering factor for nuclear proteasome STS1 n=1 Tax=Hohenbuehelia grisea TaxID=104357 RepID=A0ABR3J725_9AGAR